MTVIKVMVETEDGACATCDRPAVTTVERTWPNGAVLSAPACAACAAPVRQEVLAL